MVWEFYIVVKKTGIFVGDFTLKNNKSIRHLTKNKSVLKSLYFANDY